VDSSDPQYGYRADSFPRNVFDGSNKGAWLTASKAYQSRLAMNGVKFLTRGKPWMVTSQNLYAPKDSEQTAWTAIETADPVNAAIVLQRSLKVGDLKLSPKSYKDYKKEDDRVEMQRSQARSFLLEMCR